MAQSAMTDAAAPVCAEAPTDVPTAWISGDSIGGDAIGGGHHH
jgi:hypothetical protein